MNDQQEPRARHVGIFGDRTVVTDDCKMLCSRKGIQDDAIRKAAWEAIHDEVDLYIEVDEILRPLEQAEFDDDELDNRNEIYDEIPYSDGGDDDPLLGRDPVP